MFLAFIVKGKNRRSALPFLIFETSNKVCLLCTLYSMLLTTAVNFLDTSTKRELKKIAFHQVIAVLCVNSL